MSKIECVVRMDSVELDGVTAIQLNEVQVEGQGHRRAIVVTTEVGDFRIVLRAKSGVQLGIKVPARITL